MQSRYVSVAVAAAMIPMAAAAQGRRGAPPPSQPVDMAAMHCAGGMAMMGGMGFGRTDMVMRGMRGMPADSMRRMMPMMQAMAGPPTPAAILLHKRDLALSAAQVTRLEDLQKRAEPECIRHMNLAMTAHMAANQLLEPSAPDFAAYSAKLNEGMSHMVESHLVMVKAAVAARDVLTAAQRVSLKRLMAGMRPG